jgi:hypothetical protein
MSTEIRYLTGNSCELRSKTTIFGKSTNIFMYDKSLITVNKRPNRLPLDAIQETHLKRLNNIFGRYKYTLAKFGTSCNLPNLFE